MAKARKFKKKLAPKTSHKKNDAVLSVELIRKEYIEKLTKLWKHLVSKAKSFKIAH